MNKSNQILIKKANVADLPEIYLLLEELNLPITGISEHLDNFILSIHNNLITGIIGLEMYGKIGLLRSVGVRSSYQSQRIGDDLMMAIQEYAKFKSVERIYLFTDTAEKWFEQYGFNKISNDQLDPILQRSKEYSLCKSSVKMLKTLKALEGYN